MSKINSIAISSFISQEVIVRKIYWIRGKKVMLDRDLAALYQTETRVLNQAVRRNIKRFPDDFMFVLTREEIKRVSQIVIPLKYANNVSAFTEHGVAMLSSVLHSEKAIQVNIEIIRIFTRLREFILSHKELQNKIDSLERQCNEQFRSVFQAIRALEEPLKKKRGRQIGFHSTV